jgi:hypothetical protein
MQFMTVLNFGQQLLQVSLLYSDRDNTIEDIQHINYYSRKFENILMIF